MVTRLYMYSVYPSLLILFAMLTGTTLDLCAQSKDTLELSGIEVTDDRPLYKHPHSKHLSDTGLLAFNNNEDLGKILSRRAGMHLNSYGRGGVSNLMFRGTNSSQSVVRWNGITLNSSFLGGFDLSQIYGGSIDRIRIGDGALSGYPGATIDLYSRIPEKQGRHLELRTSYGSFRTTQGTMSAGYSGKKISYLLNVSHIQSDNDFPYTHKTLDGRDTSMKRRFADYQNSSLTQGLKAKVNDKLTVSIHSFLQQGDRNLPSGIHMSQESRKESLEESRGAHIVSIQLGGSSSTAELHAAYKHQKYIYQYHPSSLETVTYSKALTFSADYASDISNTVRSRTKLELTKQFVESDNYQTDAKRLEFSGSQSIDIRITPKLRLTPYSRILLYQGQKAMVLPGISMVLHSPERDGKWSLLIGRTGRIPTFNDRYWFPGGNPELEPEKGVSIEAAYEQGLSFNKLSSGFSITGFHKRTTNMIQWLPVEGSSYWSPLNLQKIIGTGLETSLHADAGIGKHKFALRGSYVLTFAGEPDKSILDIERQTRYLPRHKLDLHAAWKYRRIMLESNTGCTSARNAYLSGDEQLEAYLVSDLRLSYSLPLSNSVFRITLKAENIGNTNYESIPWYPMPGRNYRVSIKYNIHSKSAKENDYT